jgi:cell division cycle 14
VGIYQVLYLNRSPEDAYAPLAPKGPYMPFRDASCGIPTFNLQPIDCIRVGHAASAAGVMFAGQQQQACPYLNIY